MIQSLQPQLAVRLTHPNPNHHLWNNHGTWWCHYTLHLPDYTKRRVRVSLGTRQIEEARLKRDQLLSQVDGENQPLELRQVGWQEVA